MFRFVLVFFVMLFAGVVFAGPDFSVLFDDCVYFRSADCVTGTDTLWFTTLQQGAGTGLSYDGGTTVIDPELSASSRSGDAFPPTGVPVGNDGEGQIVRLRKPVRKVLLYSVLPFTVQTHSSGRAVADQLYPSIVDTVASGIDGGASKWGDYYPCWTVVSYPDSIYIAESGADSVRVVVGY